MFRRLDAGLPKDPIYPTTLEGLGYALCFLPLHVSLTTNSYFVNEQDEIRNKENHKAYFKYFLTKNERYNIMQREAMNEAIRNIISERLTSLGLTKIRLPLNVEENSPNVPIFISSDLKTKKRVLILFYEQNQDLGVFAHRIIGGQGGINVGSAIDMVKYIQHLPNSPGIILANIGQLLWCRRGRKAVTQTSWMALPQKSAVELPYRIDIENNTVPGNRNTAEHVEYIFNHVVENLCDPTSKLDVIGVGEGAVKVAEFLAKKEIWKRWGGRMEAFAAIATYYHASDNENADFARWLRRRGRAFLVSQEPCGAFLAGPAGKKLIPAHGCPVFSLGEPYYTETMLPKGYRTVVDWFQVVSKVTEYVNPAFAFESDSDEEEEIDTPGINFDRVDQIAD
ncbi:hypothetical protein D0Z07_3475 [Hyphodiscus hymeniophilus]|uniref:Arb2 domain-containing protein n=1 Tax=Hyphodiscus hymeniophilus TaxID=353542 RepID=A0A9P6VMS2_9HELO|nr:hypothetical protein D0Z07_3475 [Hyphodiscus hymeniophilus]